MTEQLDWNDIVKDVGPSLLRYFSASFPHSIASDLVQEVFIRLVKKHRQGEYDQQKGSLRMFSFGIAHYVRLEAIKAAPVEDYFAEVTDYDSRVNDGFASDQHRERLLQLRQAIGTLNEHEKQIILLHIDNELTLVEISSIIKAPIGTVKSHVHRAKEKLKARLLSQE